MLVYLDSSALLKRVVVEDESASLVAEIDRYVSSHALLVSSSLAWVEVARALRKRLDARFVDVVDHVDDALSGVSEHRIEEEVAGLSRRLNPNLLRSLDAIHLASALVLDADVLLTYDDRLAEACTHNGVPASAPGRSRT